MSVTTHRKDNMGYVEIDNAPVNAIGLSVRRGLLEAVRWAEAENLERIILSGKGGIFAAGADAKEFDSAPVEPHLPEVINAIENSSVPWVAAIQGVALGGGAEIALACRMRFMAVDARIGFPEVTLGVIPGAGGTLRLPPLVGLTNALNMITSGKPLNASTSLSVGLVYDVGKDPLSAASGVDSEILQRIKPINALPKPEADPAVLEAAREHVCAKMTGQVAPMRAIDVIQSGLTLSFNEGSAIERQTFLELRSGDQAKALRHIFFAERAAKQPASIVAKAIIPEHVAVVGGGTMGSGIAYALLNAGLRVTVLETDDPSVERARGNVASIIAASVKRGLIDDDGAAARSARFKATTDFSDVDDASLAIEAAFENLDVKHNVLAKLERVLPAKAVIASNTSYLDLNEIAATAADPSRVVGLHFFAPAHIMKLLEMVRGVRTSDVALATGFALAKRLKKIPVMVGVCDGFVGNRILARYREAADTVLMDGSTPWDIDAAMVEFGYAMGPYTAQDLSGLDIAHANRRRQDATRDPARRYVPVADKMVDLGKLGRKTRAGWYRYPAGGGRVNDPDVVELAVEAARVAGVVRVAYSSQEIRDRLVLAMINEAADILQEGIAQSAADIDLVTVFGYGFPRWRGGLMHYADSLGAKTIVARLEQYAEEDQVAWKISPMLRRCAELNTAIAGATE